MKRRTIAYLLPWGVWSFIVRGVIFGQSNFLNVKWLLWHMDSGYWFLATIWTISMIFGVSTFVAKKLAKDSEVKKQLITLILYIVGMGVLVAIGFVAGLSFLAIKLTIYYMPFYFAGYLYGQYRDRFLETRWGKTVIDVVVAICLAAWLLIMTRFHLYALPDSGMAIILRATSSIMGCIAICGLCKGLFDIAPNITVPPEDRGDAYNGKFTGNCANVGLLRDDSHADTSCGESNKLEQGVETCSLWKQRVGNWFLWAGKKSLEIYMVHGLLLDVLMPKAKPEFPSIEGYGLITGNFVITITLCVVVISLVSQNNILKKILGIK